VTGRVDLAGKAPACTEILGGKESCLRRGRWGHAAFEYFHLAGVALSPTPADIGNAYAVPPAALKNRILCPALPPPPERLKIDGVGCHPFSLMALAPYWYLSKLI
jgi:hypothetical protein